MTRAHRFSSRAQPGAPPALGPRLGREAWARAVDQCLRLSGVAAAASEAFGARTAVEVGGEHAQLVGALKVLSVESFPVETWSAREIAGAFLKLARAFVRPEMAPEARTACAAFLHAGAQAVEDLLVARRDADAAGWRGRFGERED